MSESSNMDDEDDECPHINYTTVDTLNCSRKILNYSSWDKCQINGCAFLSNPLYGCLQCGFISCIDIDYKGHAEDHCSKKHPIAINIHSHKIWCFLCARQIYNDTKTQSIQSLISSLKSLQQRHLTRIKADDDVIVVSSIKAKQFDEKDKAENANAHYQMLLIRKIFNHWRNMKKKPKSIPTKMNKKKLCGNKRKRKELESEEKDSDDTNDTNNKNNKARSCPPKKKRKNAKSKNFAGRTGLRNLGNTCYFNSSVQCLNSTDTFRKFFLNLPGLVPKNALTAPLPDLPPLKSAKNNRNTRNSCRRNVRNVQTRSSLKKLNRSLSINQKNKNKNKNKNIKIRRSARLQSKKMEKTNDNDTDNDTDNMSLDTSSDDSPSPSPSLPAPSHLLLRRATTVLVKTMENSLELKANVPISLSAEVYSLLRIFESGKYSVITPQRLAMSIWNTVPQFSSYRQQDAQEFLSLFLERLQQEIQAFDQYDINDNKSVENKNKVAVQQRPSHYVKESFECSMISETTCDECSHKSYYRPPGHKFITLDIYGAITKILQCKKNKLMGVESDDEKSNSNSNSVDPKVNKNKNKKKQLTLRQLSTQRAFDRSLKSYSSCSLIDLLNTLNAPVIFSGDNMYECDKCNKKVSAIKRDYYQTLPNVLVFHLCRAYYNLKNDKQEKLQNHIGFPLENLKMRQYCFDNGEGDGGDVGYDLVAALVHCGKSMSYGHYVSYCYHSETDRWLKFDDVKVSVCSEKTVRQSQAYLLFYEKQNISDWVDSYICDLRKQMGNEL